MQSIKVEFIEKMGSCLSVVNAARVSMGKAHTEFDSENDMRLLRYLVKHNHNSPFFHPHLSVRVTAPIFVARQLLRSTVGLSVNEISRRYVDEEPEFYYPAEWRERPKKGIKQGSGDVIDDDPDYLDWVYQAGLDAAKNAYHMLLNAKVAPEMARMILPQSMLTQWIWTGSLAAFYRVYKLRIDSHAQKESQMIAEQIGELCAEHFPYCWTALNEQQ